MVDAVGERKVLAAVGELILDVATHSDVEPTEGQVPGRITFSLGGCAANVALAAQRAGAQARFIGHQGEDAESFLLGETLSASGVEMAAVVRGVGARVSIMSGAWGYRAVIAVNDCVSLTRSDFDDRSLDDVGVVHLNSHHFFEPLTEAWFDRVVERATALGIPRSLDVSALNRVMGYGLDTFWAKVEVIRPKFLFASEIEWQWIEAGLPSNAVEFVIVHRGTQPTLVLSSDGSVVEVPVKPVDSVVRIVGAGDAMAGGTLAEWLRGTVEIEQIVESGHARAAEWISSVPEVPRHRQ